MGKNILIYFDEKQKLRKRPKERITSAMIGDAWRLYVMKKEKETKRRTEEKTNQGKKNNYFKRK